MTAGALSMTACNFTLVGLHGVQQFFVLLQQTLQAACLRGHAVDKRSYHPVGQCMPSMASNRTVNTANAAWRARC